MNRLSVALLAGLLLLSLLPSATAQSADAPHLSPDVQTLYAHAADDDTLWMNTLADDGAAAAVACCPGVDALVGPEVQGEFEFRLPLSPALERTIILDEAGSIDATMYIGGGAASAGSAQVTTRLLLGETVIAEAGPVSHSFTPKTEAGVPYDVVTVSMDVLVDTLAAGEELVWVIEGSGSWNNLFLSVGEGRGRSNLVLPVLSADAAAPTGPVLSILTDDFAPDHANLSVQADNATSGPLNRTWESGLTNATVTFTGNVTNGTVTVALRDNATTLLELNLTGEVNQTVEITGALLGNWTLDLVFTDFTGNLAMTVQPVSEDDGHGHEGEGDDHGHEHEDEESGSRWIPAPGLGVLLVGLGAVAALRRRD